ncbi:MAG: hypothetical protein NTV88_00240, partial [Candidatus Micrarchaeota archaeon]|nr:hypothetical protein [Candidatus Micrarchaeota archaeon]
MESKQTRALIFLVASAAALILLSGCTLSVPNSDKLSQADWTVTQYTPPGDLQCKPLPGAFPCYCMICKNHTNWAATLANYLHPWFDGSLKAGECNFDECTPTTFQETITDPAKMKTTQGRALMFGMGPSFYSTDNADLYCKYTLQLATKWMVGKSGPPKVPAAYRAECWLDRNVMPVYIYYTAGQYIDPARTGEIAAELDGVGPALVTTEVDLDSSDPSQIADVKAQLDALQSCAKCKKVLAVHSGDMFALEQILGPPGTPSSYYNKVDLVGFGFRANDYLKCDVTSIIGQNYLFSRDILNKYNKPTIWLYAGASEGKNVDGSCEWSPQMVHDFYQGIYSTSIGMASSGIIGSSFYEFVDGTGPLPCTPDEGCRFGVMKADGTQKHPEINTWSDLCRQYGSQDFRNPLIFSKNGQGAVCDVANSAQIHAGISTEINSNVPLSTVDVVPMDRQAKLGCGEVCVSESKMKEPDIYDNTGGSIAQAHCAEYPIIDELADDADFSSLYYRAVVEQESGFDPLIASCVDNSNNNCNVAGESLSKICSDAGMAGCHTTSGAADCPSGQKPCAFGLAQ